MRRGCAQTQRKVGRTQIQRAITGVNQDLIAIALAERGHVQAAANVVPGANGDCQIHADWDVVDLEQRVGWHGPSKPIAIGRRIAREIAAVYAGSGGGGPFRDRSLPAVGWLHTQSGDVKSAYHHALMGDL